MTQVAPWWETSLSVRREACELVQASRDISTAGSMAQQPLSENGRNGPVGDDVLVESTVGGRRARDE